MEPLPPTEEALAEIVSFDDPDLDELLSGLGQAASRLVPGLVGLSLGLRQEQLTFTLVASGFVVSALDAAQYLDGGPCVEVGQGRAEMARHTGGDPLDEDQWRLFAAATSHHGVGSTLSLPIHEGGEIIGSVNLYGATPDAFDAHVEELAALVGAAPTEAVRNADLSFSTRLEAAAAPQRLHVRRLVETAVGLVAADKGIDLDAAHEELLGAAARAGLHVTELAQVVVEVYRHEVDD